MLGLRPIGNVCGTEHGHEFALLTPGFRGGGAGGAAADVGQKAAVGRGRCKCASSGAWIGSPSASAIGCGSRPRPDNMIVAVGVNQCDSDGLACRGD